jgi:hypothetical protein
MRKLIALLTVNAILLALFLELGLRLQEPFLHLLALGDFDSPNNLIVTQYHPIWHHQLRGGMREIELRMPFDGGENYTISTNRLGLRDREIQVPKPAGLHRILVIGDSFTQGHQRKDTASVRLEQNLGQDIRLSTPVPPAIALS